MNGRGVNGVTKVFPQFLGGFRTGRWGAAIAACSGSTGLVSLAFGLTGPLAQAQVPPLPTPNLNLQITVNSAQDGPVLPDEQLTLREAIELANGSLTLEQLSEAERAQVSPATAGNSQIGFNLPAEQTTIRLQSGLPPLASPGLVLDGTTQSTYEAGVSAINELPLPVPVVAIAPAEGQFILRGLTVAADGVTIRGLSIYGFTQPHGLTASTPPADIFIAHRFAPPDVRKHPIPANFSVFYADDAPPKGVVIENNWIGIPPTCRDTACARTGTEPRSAFGVSVFNAVDTVIRRNWIADHDGSGIITGARATGTRITENAILGNGLAGMPDAIRLEGEVNQSEITGNLMCGNDGSGVYLFKPSGSVRVNNNQIVYNGRRFRRAAVYLMGSNHDVTENQIRYQAGPGVVVAAYPTSVANQIVNNRFSALEGLSIDLITHNQTGVFDYAIGDGPNPPRNSSNRRRDTGNAAIAAPQFVSESFMALGAVSTAATDTPLLQSPEQVSNVQVFGQADPGAQIELYRVTETGDNGALAEPLATTAADAAGRFSATLNNVRLGERVSAIATLPTYGTSEPAAAATIQSVNATANLPTGVPAGSPPRCVTSVVQQPPPEEPPPEEPITLTVPKNVHFALDQSNISAASAKVLDRIAAVLQANPTITVDIIGHTDPRASDAYNLELGRRRAISARNYLIRKGIAPERMTIRSQGERERLTQGTSRVDYARDRRAEFIYKDARNIEVIVQEEDLQIEGGGR